MEKRMKINRSVVTEQQLIDHERDFFYSDYKNRTPWEPFEYYSEEQIEGFIRDNIWAMKDFLEIKD